eukprot:scaffold70009_cov20-Prasinocladus_malaysianus.AAC.1
MAACWKLPRLISICLIRHAHLLESAAAVLRIGRSFVLRHGRMRGTVCLHSHMIVQCSRAIDAPQRTIVRSIVQIQSDHRVQYNGIYYRVAFWRDDI